jgi:hypothetical protein
VARAAWAGVGKVAMLGGAPPLNALPSIRRQNASTAGALWDGFVAADEKDPARKAGKIGVNVASLFAPSPVKGPLGALARAGEGLAAKGSVGARIAGNALRLPSHLHDGRWLLGDVRLGRAAARSLDLPKVGDLLRSMRGAGWHAAEHPHVDVDGGHGFEGKSDGILREHHDAVDRVSERATAERAETAGRHLDERQRILDDARRDAEGRPAAERTRIFREATGRIREAGSRHVAENHALDARHERALERAESEFRRRVDELRADHGLPRRYGPATQATLDAARDAWNRLPEQVRDALRVWEKGPVGVASGLDEGFLDGNDPADVTRQVTRFLDFLRDHPELVDVLDRPAG